MCFGGSGGDSDTIFISVTLMEYMLRSNRILLRLAISSPDYEILYRK